MSYWQKTFPRSNSELYFLKKLNCQKKPFLTLHFVLDCKKVSFLASYTARRCIKTVNMTKGLTLQQNKKPIKNS